MTKTKKIEKLRLKEKKTRKYFSSDSFHFSKKAQEKQKNGKKRGRL
jgi:hypothetical protein